MRLALPGILCAVHLSAGAGPVSLDDVGLRSRMAAPEPLFVKFDGGGTAERTDQIWSLLSEQTADISRITFASVDCDAHAAVCAARKVDPVATGTSIVKYWSGIEGEGFRRFAGDVAYDPLRKYVVKKLQEREMKLAERQMLRERAGAGGDGGRAQRPPERQEQGGGRGRYPLTVARNDDVFLLMTLLAVGTVLTVCNLVARWLRQPTNEEPGTLVLVGTAAAGICIYRLDESTGALTPVAKLPLEELPCPTTLAVAPGATSQGSYVVHAASDVAGASSDVSGSAATTRVLTLIFDARCSPCLDLVRSTTLPAAETSDLVPVGLGPRFGGGAYGLLACSTVVGNVTWVPPDQTTPVRRVGRLNKWWWPYAGRRPADDGEGASELVRPAASSAAASAATSEGGGGLCIAPVTLDSSESRAKHGGDGFVKGFVAAAEAEDAISLYVLDPALAVPGSGERDADGSRRVGRQQLPSGARPHAVATHPVAPVAYVLCVGSRSVAVVELSTSVPMSTLQTLSLRRHGAGGGAAETPPSGCMRLSEDGEWLYVSVSGAEAEVHALAVGVGGRSLTYSGRAPIHSPPDGKGKGVARPAMPVAMSLGGTRWDLLVVCDAVEERLVSFRREGGALTRLGEGACETPCSAVALQWPPPSRRRRR